jgi:hypothetical protein
MIAKHSPSYELYLAFVLLLDRLAYATTNFQPSSSHWVSTIPNLKYSNQYVIRIIIFEWVASKRGLMKAWLSIFERHVLLVAHPK